MFILHNEDHVKTGQYSWHEVYVLKTKKNDDLFSWDHQNTAAIVKANYKINAFTSSPFVSSQRPKTEFAAASTEHLEFNVVVIPA